MRTQNKKKNTKIKNNQPKPNTSASQKPKKISANYYVNQELIIKKEDKQLWIDRLFSYYRSELTSEEIKDPDLKSYCTRLIDRYLPNFENSTIKCSVHLLTSKKPYLGWEKFVDKRKGIDCFVKLLPEDELGIATPHKIEDADPVLQLRNILAEAVATDLRSQQQTDASEINAADDVLSVEQQPPQETSVLQQALSLTDVIKERVESMQRQIQNMSDDKDKLGCSLDSLRDENTRLKHDVKEYDNAKSSLVNDYEKKQLALNEEIKKLGTKIAGKQKEIDNLDKENRKLKDDNENKDKQLAELEEQNKKYTEHCLFYPEIQPLAKKIQLVFEAVDKVEQAIAMLKAKDSYSDIENLAALAAHSDQKYSAAVKSITSLVVYRTEVALAARTGIVLTGGELHNKLKGVADRAQLGKAFVQSVYNSVLKKLGGAAVARCDDYAFAFPKVLKLNGLYDTKRFESLSSQLQQTLRDKDLGFTLLYVKPFTNINDYQNVRNVVFSELDVPTGTITDVVEMALNYGVADNPTLVSSKQ